MPYDLGADVRFFQAGSFDMMSFAITFAAPASSPCVFTRNAP